MRGIQVLLQRPFTKNPALALYGLLIEDTRVLEGNFLELSYSHTKREGNEFAHYLARLALTLSDPILTQRERVTNLHIIWRD